MIMNILKLPGQVLTINVAFRFNTFANTPQPISLIATSFAARYRTAKIIAPEWEYWNCRLARVRSETEKHTLSYLVNDSHSPPHWSLPPIACLMKEAANNFENEMPGISKTVKEIVIPKGKGQKEQGKTTPTRFQNKITKAILPILVPFNTTDFLTYRINKVFAAATDTNQTEDDIRQALEFSKTATPHLNIVCAKTLCNGWTTKRRTQQAAQPCPFSELQIERLSHIITCPAVWQLILVILKLELELDTRVNLALAYEEDVQTRKTRFLALWTAYTIYHSLRKYQNLTSKTIYNTA